MLKTVASSREYSNLIPIIHILIAILLIGQVHTLTLTVAPGSKTINSVTVFDWTISGLTGTFATVMLRFPTVVTLNATGTTMIQTNTNSTYGGTTEFSGNNITITLVSTEQANSSLFFRVTNIQNPPYQFSENAWFHRNTVIGSAYVSFEKGPITDCTLSFDGRTDATVSKAYLDFKTTNPIANNRTVFRIYYSSYTLLTTTITQNNNITCAYSVNGGALSSQVVATYPSPGSPIFDCSFSGLNLMGTTTIQLRLSNVRNPPYKSNYLVDPFRVESLDGVFFYDSTAGCTLSEVEIDTYQATYTESSKLVNTVYFNPKIQTLQQISKNFAANDRILIEHDNIQFPSIGGYILLSRVSSSYPAIQFGVSSGTSNTTIITQSNVGNAIQETKKIQVELLSFGLKVPASSTPVTMLFRFFRNYPFNTSISLEFLNIFVILRPVAATFDISDLVATPSVFAIGTKTSYEFKINISQPLSTAPYILILLPLELDISQFNSATSSCILRSIEPNTNAACVIYDSNNKVMQVNIFAVNGISAPQWLNITIGDIINADNPEKSYQFGVETYYKQDDPTSKVQLGAALTNVTYLNRIMNIVTQTPNPGYTVDYFPSILTINYRPGVKIPANLIIIFTFTSSLSLINYKNVTVNGAPVVYSKLQSGQVINLTVSAQIPINAAVVFKFQFKAPAIVNDYPAYITEIRSASGVLYEKQASIFSITVSYPANQLFSLTPLLSMTGVQTNYTLSFYTNVIHPTTFYLSIKFPSDIVIPLMSAVKCAPNSTCKSIIPINSNPGSQQICLNITAFTTSSTYTITITNITNSRKIGASGNFNIQTLTNPPNTVGSNQILNGSCTTTIGNPNTANATFDLTKSYYRSNLEPVSMNMSFFNDLQMGDFIRIRFDYRTHVLASTGAAGIKCTKVTDFTCVYDADQSTSFSTVVKVTPKTTLSLVEPIAFAIQGLNSSSTTFPSQRFEITIRSYSSDDRQMDETKIFYNISCANSTAILSKNCKTCNENTSICYSCYIGTYLLNGACVSECSSFSSYRTYSGTDQCMPCTNQCFTCISSTQCLSCVPNYYLYQDSTCKNQCNRTNGYYINTINSQPMCLKCWSPSCLQCTSGSSNACTNCGSAFQDPNNPGRCVDQCDLSSNYVDNLKQCIPCDKRCIGCSGRTNSDCSVCRPGYYNVSEACVQTCPKYTVPMLDRTCSCSGRCDKCQLVDTRCITCKDPSDFLYNYQCLTTCPNSSYNNSGKCFDCNTGCLSCTANACLECLSGYNVYQNKCYTECNSVGQRFSAVNGTCIQCPEGCDLCNAALQCSVCLGNFTLMGTVCTQTCLLQNNCDPVNPVPDKILPLPGFISACAWLIILIVLKIFFLPKIYLPYAYIFLSCIIEIVVSIAVLSKMNDKLQTLILNTSSRLLQTVSTASTQKPKPYQYAVIGILATTIALNFIFNFVYLFLFCKYLRKYIPDRQIDKISNYLVVALGTLTNFRFSLLAYSKLFPKPNILVQNQSKLTPLHYMCIASIFTSFFPLTASCILIYNQYPLTDLFMLGIDLLMIVLISLVFTIWMVSVDKPSEYFQGTKKYSKEEVNNTVENLNEKQNGNDNSNSSKHKITSSVYNNHLDHSVIHVEDLNQEIDQKSLKNISKVNKVHNNKSDNENQPLPNIPIRTSTVNIETMKVKAREQDNDLSDLDSQQLEDQKKKKNQHTFSERKTQRYKNNKTEIKKYTNQKPGPAQVEDHERPIQGGIKSRNKESIKNFTKEKKAIKKKDKNKEDLNIKINQISDKNQANDQSQYIDDSLDMNEISMNKARSDNYQKQKKPLKSQTQRSSVILPVTMKKKQSFGMFQSQKAVSQIDEVDFESLIQTKMIDKTKQKQNTVPTNLKYEQPQHEQISPSWFNQQNQRFDVESNSDL